MSVILVAWQGKARAQRRRGTFHSGLKLKPDNDDSWKFATTGSSEDITIAVVSWANGLISAYESGERSGAWIKHRTNREQEFVIGGYIPGAHGFDALLVGVYENKEFIFVAKVKHGFVPRIRDEIFPTLKTLRAARCPFTNLPEKKASRWVSR